MVSRLYHYLCFSLICLGISCASSASNLEPYNLEIGKTTIYEIHRDYHVLSVAKYTNFGKIFYITRPQVNFTKEINPHIKKLGLAFDAHGTLELIDILLDKDQFEKMNAYFTQHYTQLQDPPFRETDNYSLFRKGNCDIFILSALDTDELHVVYATEQAHEKYNHLVPHPKY
jgi:hypothetical protein